MTIKEQLIQEIEQAPDAMLQELLDFLRRLKESQDDALTAEESANIVAARQAYQHGEYQTLEQSAETGAQ